MNRLDSQTEKHEVVLLIYVWHILGGYRMLLYFPKFLTSRD